MDNILKWLYNLYLNHCLPTLISIVVNCWPNDTGSGCDVNIEYELKQLDLELHDVTILIPLP